MACLQRLRREQQRRCKAEERATSRSLLALLDNLVPSSSVPPCFPRHSHDFIPTPCPFSHSPFLHSTTSKRKHALVSGRTKEQLLQDAVSLVRTLRPKKRSKTQGNHLHQVSGHDLLAALLTSRMERYVAVDLSSWTITDMSNRLSMDWQDSVFCSNMVGQSLLHFVTVHDMDTLRYFARQLDTCERATGPFPPFRAGLRAFRKSNVVVLNVEFVPLYAKSGGKGIFLLRHQGHHAGEPNWLQCNFKDVSGELFFREEMSTASMWHVQNALELCGLKSSKTFFSWLYPSISSTETSKTILDLTARATHSGLNVKKVVFDFLMRHMGLHVMLDASSPSEANIHLHVRLHMPKWMGGIKTPWVNLLSHRVNGRPVVKLSDEYQDIYVFTEWNDENSPYNLIAFFCAPSTGICYHTRTWSFGMNGILHEGQVFKCASEEPFRYRIFLQKRYELDITLLPHLID